MPITRPKNWRELAGGPQIKLDDALDDLRRPMSKKALQDAPLDTRYDGQYILMPPSWYDRDALQAPPDPLAEDKSNLKYTLCTPTVQTDIFPDEPKAKREAKKIEAPPDEETGQYILMPPRWADPDALQAPPAKGKPNPPIRFSKCVPTSQPAVDPYAYPYYPWEFQQKSGQQKRQLNDLLRWNGPGEEEEVSEEPPSAEELERMERTAQAAWAPRAPPRLNWRTVWV